MMLACLLYFSNRLVIFFNSMAVAMKKSSPTNMYNINHRN